MRAAGEVGVAREAVEAAGAGSPGALAAREGCRSALWAARRRQRSADLGRRRDLPPPGTSSLRHYTTNTVESVHIIANQLKTSAAVSTADLTVLKNALIQDESNIDLFLQTHGALRGLVRELTGTDTVKQTLAATCCCNLALSEVKSTQIIAKAVGSYLLPCLDSLNRELAVTSAWTLGNLAGSHAKVCEILISQGAMSKLVSLLCSTGDDEMQEALCYALVHFMYILKHDVRSDTVATVINAVTSMRRNSETYHLLYLLSCHQQFSTLETVNSELVSIIMKDFSYHSECLIEKLDSVNIIYLVRTLANMCTSASNSDCVLLSFKNPMYFAQLSNALSSKNVVLHKSILWLLGNIFNFASYNEEKQIFFLSLSEKIII